METPDQEKLRKVMEEQNSEERAKTLTVMFAIIAFMGVILLAGIIALKQWMN